MNEFDTTRLRDCIAHYRERIPGFDKVSGKLEGASLDSLVGCYEDSTDLIEAALWDQHTSDAEFEALLDCYQGLFREQEALIGHRIKSQAVADDRYHFILSIPVADRPSHLRACLDSIYQLCRLYGYGGTESGVYSKISIVVAEDSREQGNIEQHLALIDEFRRKGLQIVHFGQDEQYELLHATIDALPAAEQELLGKLLTTQPREQFYLKGQAANRNLSYLKCLQLTEDRQRTLYYFVDSDESFCVNRQGHGAENAEQVVYALNYFYLVDRVFRNTDTRMLTGKMVGDPPVSPSVMTVNFLDDVIAFFTRLAATRGEGDCRFHALSDHRPGDAAYHDMAGLFGFEHAHTSYPYHCPLHGAHDNAACLAGFARKLNAFFFGEHLTRKTLFGYHGRLDTLTPARTVYPGNYVVNYDGLKYVIPFGDLRLRMSGPTAGRLIAAEIGSRFASINLPHLHRRTTDAGLGKAFRPGVELEDRDEQGHIDLSNEFERQFFGDLMLFSTEALMKQVDVNLPLEEHAIVEVIDNTEQNLLALYRQKKQAIAQKSAQLNALVFEQYHWWLASSAQSAQTREALQRVNVFIENIDNNFGEQAPAWRDIQSAEHRAARKRQIVDALVHYRAERDAWDRLFDRT